jgi:hypothetical protein
MRILITTVTLLAALAAPAFAQEAAYHGPTRVNFDERLIKGQTAKSGSVYIFERQEMTAQSLLNRKRSFRQRTIRTVFEE